ncbi:hypothetical protein STEG23_025720, partial [Scotinomys teguina]
SLALANFFYGIEDINRGLMYLRKSVVNIFTIHLDIFLHRWLLNGLAAPSAVRQMQFDQLPQPLLPHFLSHDCPLKLSPNKPCPPSLKK